MTVASVLNAVTMGAWALFLGMLVASYRSGKPARRRWLLAIIAGIWLVLAAVRLWHEPAIEPLWLQYVLVALLPGVVGFGFAAIAQLFRAAPPEAPTEEPSAEEGAR